MLYECCSWYSWHFTSLGEGEGGGVQECLPQVARPGRGCRPAEAAAEKAAGDQQHQQGAGHGGLWRGEGALTFGNFLYTLTIHCIICPFHIDQIGTFMFVERISRWNASSKNISKKFNWFFLVPIWDFNISDTFKKIRKTIFLLLRGMKVGLGGIDPTSPPMLAPT